jgi:hypothetical protein
MERDLSALLKLDLFQKSHPAVREVLRKDLEADPNDSVNANNLPEWENMGIPSLVPEIYNANLRYATLQELWIRYQSDRVPLEFQELINYAIIFSGVHPLDRASRDWARLSREYPPSESFPFITGKFNGRRMPARAIPPNFQQTDRLHTPFYVKGADQRCAIEILLDVNNQQMIVGTMDELLPLDSPSVVAYMRQARGPDHKQKFSITINPLLSCGERCVFCYRQYGLWGNTQLGAQKKFPLVRIQPETMAEYLAIKFSQVDFSRLSYIGLVTGAFKNYADLYNYIDSFVSSLYRVTNGGFNIGKNGQGITLLTHLATTREKMLALKKAGVIELEHTLEMFDDQKKRKIIPVLSKSDSVSPKSDIGFDQVLSLISQGIEIFGDDRFSVTAILGIDDYDTTVRGLKSLRRGGLAKLSFPVYQTYNRTGMSLYRMSFEELIETRQLAKNLFVRQY